LKEHTCTTSKQHCYRSDHIYLRNAFKQEFALSKLTHVRDFKC